MVGLLWQYEMLKGTTKPTLVEAWGECSLISDLYPGMPRDSHDLVRAIGTFAGYVGVTPNVLQRAISKLGIVPAMIALNYVAGRVEHVRNVPAYLTSMVQRYHRGEAIAGGRIRSTSA